MPTIARPSGAAWPDAAPPATDDPLVGREALVADLATAFVAGPAHVVLSGLGGVGKTRIATEVARRFGEAFDRRVAWVDLSPACRDAGIETEIATAFGLRGSGLDEMSDALAETVGSEPALLVLDGVEVVLHDLGLLDLLAEASSGLRLLMTSRIAIERPGLRSVAVASLPVPDPHAGTADVAASPAVELLLDRAASAGAKLAVTDASAPALSRLVRRLDGLPLAIELVAPMLRALPPHLVVDRLGRELVGVETTIAWSVDQLPPDAQRLYRRLAVFGGSFGLADLEAYAGRSIAHGLAPIGPDLGGDLEQLVAAGLVRRRASIDPDASTRYELPTLVREDAGRRLAETGTDTAAHWAYAMCLLDLAEDADRQLQVRSNLAALQQIDSVHDDLVAALDRARQAHEGAFMVRLAGALAEYWRSRGRLAEGRIWLDAALRVGPPDRTADRARALHGAGMLANWQSDFGRGRRLLEEALAIRLELGRRAEAAATLNQLALIALETGNLRDAERHARDGLAIRRELGDEAAVAASANTLGGVLQFEGRGDEARGLFEESLEIRRRLGDVSGVSVSLGNLGLVARDAGDLPGAEAILREAVATRERLGDRQRAAVVRHNLALVLFDAGDLDGARTELEAALATARELGDKLEASNALSDLGFVEGTAGRLDRAAARQAEALALAARIGARGIVAQALDGAACIAAGRGERDTAATLWAAAGRIRSEAHAALLLADRRRIERETDAARAATEPAQWDAAWRAGADLDDDAAIARALVALGAPMPSPRAAGRVAV
jgi:predicted ATPase